MLGYVWLNSSISSFGEAQLELLFVSISSNNLLNSNKGGNGERVRVSSGVDIMTLVLVVEEMD